MLTPQAATTVTTPAESTHAFFNRLEGDESARQLDETIDEFLKRLPPKSSPGHWVWIENPHMKGKGKAKESIGNSQRLKDRSDELLERYDTQRAIIESDMAGKAQSAITRKLTPVRKKLREDLLKVAVEEKCLSGKVRLHASLMSQN